MNTLKTLYRTIRKRFHKHNFCIPTAHKVTGVVIKTERCRCGAYRCHFERYWTKSYSWDKDVYTTVQ